MPYQHYSPYFKMVVVRLLLRGEPQEEICNTICVQVSKLSMLRWLDLSYKNQAVIANPALYKEAGAKCLLTLEQEEFLVDALCEDPTLYLDEVAVRCYEGRGVVLSLALISKELNHRVFWTRKVAHKYHPNQSLQRRGEYLLEVAQIDPHCLVFLGEYLLQDIIGWS